jgi:hypothetical protein
MTGSSSVPEPRAVVASDARGRAHDRRELLERLRLDRAGGVAVIVEQQFEEHDLGGGLGHVVDRSLA